MAFKTIADYDHGIIMAAVPQDLANILLKDIAPKIPADILDDEKDEMLHGIETDSHITVLYGPDTNDPDIIAAIQDYFYEPVPIKSRGEIEYFDNDDNSVAIVKVDSDELSDLHAILKDNLDNEDSFDEYSPHITIAYLKPGERLPIETIEPFEWTIDTLILGKTDGTQEELKLGVSTEESLTATVQASDTSVFLGGEAKSNEWREEIIEDFADELELLDPYDENWEASENIYEELTDMLTADEVIFYKGGDGTKKEKKLLEEVGGDYKEFKDLDEVKDYLKTLSAVLVVYSTTTIPKVFHGGNSAELTYPAFFSLDRGFAEDYGDIISEYTLKFDKLFDSGDEQHMKELFDTSGFLTDPFDDATYNSWEELQDANLIGHDTWELIEEYANDISGLGYDGALIYEGGIQNYMSFDDTSVLPISNTVVLNPTDSLNTEDILKEWANYYSSPEKASENLEYYISDVSRIHSNGGAIYRVIFADTVEDIDTTDLGKHWTVTKDQANLLIDSLGKYADGEKAFIIEALLAPENISLEGVDLGANPEELEVGIANPAAVEEYRIYNVDDPKTAIKVIEASVLKLAWDKDGYAAGHPAEVFIENRDKFFGNLGDNEDYNDYANWRGNFYGVPHIRKRTLDMMGVYDNEVVYNESIKDKSSQKGDGGNVELSEGIQGLDYDDHIARPGKNTIPSAVQ